ncbi:MAG: FG-GAP-like repeat-containing protein [Vallitalea sp.]|jgi:RHS repeat-associated protein|nr:FG-GAP-like repeat-containing protein [Vallitalea sp.]
MKRIFTFYGLFLFLVLTLNGQEAQKNFVLKSSMSGDKMYIARDFVKFTHGFHFKANENNRLVAKLDRRLVFPPNSATYKDDNGVISNDPSKGAIVGAIPAQFSVSPSGAATYNIPIECPKALNGMEPKISLVYNSQSGNGLAGWGWNISGLSSIQRVPRNIHFDNELKPIQWDSSDALALDGVRLIESKRENGKIFYRKENFDPFTTIVASKINESGPELIEVIANNRTLEYRPKFYTGRVTKQHVIVTEYDDLGNSSPMLQPSGASKTYTHKFVSKGDETTVSTKYKNWVLTRISDNYGNYVSYDYNVEFTDKDKSTEKKHLKVHEIRGMKHSEYDIYSKGRKSINEFIKSIEYGHKKSAFGKIVFNYSERRSFDFIDKKISRNEMFISKRLSDIDVSYKGSFFRRYGLMGDGTVKSINVRGKNNERLSSTTFDYYLWNQFVFKDQLSPCNIATTSDERIMAVDTNNDGLSDIVKFKQEGTSLILNECVSNGHEAVHFSSEKDKKRYKVEKLNFFPVDKLSRKFGGFSILHYGEQYQIAKVFPVWKKGEHFKLGSLDNKSDVLYTSDAAYLDYQPVFQLVDMNNDGYEDIVLVNPIPVKISGSYKIKLSVAYNISYVDGNSDYFSNAENIYLDYNVVDNHGLINIINSIYIIDIDSDGFKDVLIKSSKRHRLPFVKIPDNSIRFDMYKYTNRTNFKHYSDLKLNSVGSSKLVDYEVEFGDFNGDNLLDLLVYLPNVNNLLLLNNGSGFVEKKLDFNNSVSLDEYSSIIPHDSRRITNRIKRDNYLKVYDYDGDGKSDIVHLYTDYYQETFDNYSNSCILKSGVECYRMDGLRIISRDHLVIDETNSIDNSVPYIRTKQLCVGDFNGDGFNELFFTTFNDRNELSDSYVLYNGLHETNKLHCIKTIDNGYSLKEISFSNLNDSEIYDKTEKSYKGVAKVNGAISVVSTVSSENDEVHYHYEDALFDPVRLGFIGFAKTTVTSKVTGKKGITENEFDYTNKRLSSPLVSNYIGDVLLSTNKTYSSFLFPSPNKRIFKNIIDSVESYDAINEISQTKTYDYLKNSFLTKSISSRFHNSPVVDSTLYYYDDTSSENWYKPTKEIKIKRNDIGRYVRTKQCEYNDNGEIARITYDPNDKNSKTESFVYNNDGQLTRKILSASGLDDKVIEYSYLEDDLRNVKREIANKLDTVTYEYNDYGELSCRTEKGLTTKFFYDSFGNIVKKVTPDGLTEVTTLQWNNGKGPKNALYYKYSELSGSAPVWSWYNSKNQLIRKETYGFNLNRTVCIDTKYDKKGHVISVSKPFYSDDEGSRVTDISYTYDELDRKISENTSLGKITYSYSPRKITSNSPNGTTVKKYDFANQLVGSVVNGVEVLFKYWPSGLVKSSKPNINGARPVLTTYDLQGNSIKIEDPDAGIKESEYNAWGQLVSEWYNNGGKRVDISSYTYDKRGQILTAKLGSEMTTNEYAKNGLLRKTIYSNDGGSFVQTIDYDYGTGLSAKLGLVQSKSFSINSNKDGQSIAKRFIKKFEYDEFGREKSYTYPSGFKIKYLYDKYGLKLSVLNDSGSPIWNVENVDIYGNVTSERKGNLSTSYQFDKSKRLVSSHCSSIIDYQYEYSDLNLKSRIDNITNQKELFLYDEHNQLIESSISKDGLDTHIDQWNYDFHGNMKSSSFLGDTDEMHLVFDENKVHALKKIYSSEYSNNIPNQSITYTPFNKIETIVEDDKSLFLSYGFDHRRVISRFNSSLGSKITYYCGDYEEIVSSTEAESENVVKLHYISGANGNVAVFVEEDGISSLHYLYTDHLGSVVAITDDEGVVENRFSYDAWGNRRNVDDWSLKTDVDNNSFLTRGYTFHEHLDAFHLINMNGRVYDPMLCRFLSPDPQLQNPNLWLNYNRYAYCYNNPLGYTDPSGESVVGAILFGALINTFIQAVEGNINSFGDFALYAGIGAISGVAGFGAGKLVLGSLGIASSFGGAVANGATAGFVGGFAGGFVDGTGNSWASGASFSSGINSGLKVGALGALGGAAFGGLAGGIQYMNNKSIFNRCYDIVNDGVEMQGKKVAFSDTNLKDFSDKYFGNQEGLNDLKAVDKFNNNAAGKTIPLGKVSKVGLKSDVLIAKSSFNSKFRLYNTLGHEYVHVAQNYAGLPSHMDFIEIGAYSWNKHVYSVNGKEFPVEYSMQLSTHKINMGTCNNKWMKLGYSPVDINPYMWNNLPTFKYKPF